MFSLFWGQKMIIKSIEQIKAENIDWTSIRKRIKTYRESKAISIEVAAEEMEIAPKTLENMENRDSCENVHVNLIWRLNNTWNLSLNWLLNGIGSPESEDPPDLLPCTIIIPRGVGRQKTARREDVDNGRYTDEIMEFVVAIDKFKQKNDISFPSHTQIFDLLIALGYRKSAPCRIAPLGYNIRKQKKQELERCTNG